ncbi:MAG: NlpC/P60 family protein [Coprobacillaceae bacterium]
MKKITIGLLSASLVSGLIIGANNLYATDFTGQEDKYIELCKSASLSANDQETCKEFNDYLKNKNNDLQDDISNTKDDVAESKNTLDELETDLANIKDDISSKETEISYLETSITNLETQIADKEDELRERMYSMQSYVNTNFYIDFIFSASNFTDMLSRMDSLDELTSYDKELIASLLTDKEDLVSQQDTMNTAIANLEAKHSDQETLQNQYLALYQEQNADLIAKEKESLENNNATEEIDDNLAALAAASKESEVGGVTEATPPANPTPPSTGGSEGGGGTGGESGGSATPGNSGNYQTGLAIANAALTKQGSPYGWGHNGPNSFDCSGLVYWAHNQAGVGLGRTTAAGYSSAGTAVSYNDLQAGDVITFKTIPSYVSHIGIYIGNGMMVHAPTFGIPVQVVSITSSYWQGCYYNARRLY